jgi:uncharacterized protein YhfF
VDRQGRRWSGARDYRDSRDHPGRFNDVDEALAHDEGEGDQTLSWWRQAHTNYFTRRSEFSADMELYCERFRLIEILGGE